MSADARVFDLHHTHHSNQVDRAVRELTSPVYIAVKFALGDGAGLMREFADAQNAFKGASPEAAAELGQCQATVGSVIGHLEKKPNQGPKCGGCNKSTCQYFSVTIRRCCG